MKQFITSVSLLTLAATMPAFAQQATQSDPQKSSGQQAAQAQKKKPKKAGPVSIQELKRRQQRTPAAVTGQSTAAERAKGATETQNAFLEVSPGLGSVSIFDKAAFSVGSNISFLITNKVPLYFEPGLFISFYPGRDAISGLDKNTTIFHIDAGARYDFVISDSPLIPFVKAAIGPSFVSSSNIRSTASNDTLGSSYLNQFYGGGLKVLINKNLMARADVGETFQSTTSGLYFIGSVALPL